MAEAKKNQFRFIPEYADCIANAANSWAHLEYYANSTIWALSGMEPAIGACVTAQIYTIMGRMDAIAALLKARKADPKLISRFNKFVETLREANEARNRIVHDAWMNDNVNKEMMGRLTITAQKKLNFQIVSIPIEELRADLAKIEQRRMEFAELRTAISAALPTLPEMSQKELRPITETR